MKYIIGILTGLVLSANSQFNFQINGNGFRFGILGSQVVNIGGGNAGQPVRGTNFPIQTINQIQNALNPPPIRHFTNTVDNGALPTQNIKAGLGSLPQNNGRFIGGGLGNLRGNTQGLGGMPLPIPKPTPQNQVKPQQVKKEEPKKQETTKQKQNIPQVQQQIKQHIQVTQTKNKPQIIKTKPIQQINTPNFKKNEKIYPKILDFSANKLTQKQQFELIRKKQDEKLLSAIKLMPDSQIQHLRSIVTQKTQN